MGAFDDLLKTPNFKLNKPGYGNVADIEALNQNFDILDEVLSYPAITNIYVDVNSTSALEDGTSTAPYKSIQSAIDSLIINTKSVYLYIAKGTYNEDVNINLLNTKNLIIRALTDDKPVIKSLSISGCTYVALFNLTINGLNSNNIAIEFNYNRFRLNGCNVIGSNVAESVGIITHSANGLITLSEISGFTYGLNCYYGTNVLVENTTLDNTINLVAHGSTIHTNKSDEKIMSTGGGTIVNVDVGEALSKDLYSVLIDENTFRNRALASAMSNVINTLFMEVFADTNGINKSLGDAATAIENYYNQRGHIFEKTDSGTITLYTLPQTVNTGNGKVWVYADYISKGGSVELAISRDGGTTYTVVTEGVLTDISTRPAGTTMSLRIKITGAVTLKNVAWGCK